MGFNNFSSFKIFYIWYYLRSYENINDIDYKNKYSENKEIINPNFFHKRKDQYNFKDFINLCVKNELMKLNIIISL